MKRKICIWEVVLWVGLTVLLGVLDCWGATLILPRHIPSTTAFTTNLLTAGDANEARARLGLTTGGTNQSITFNPDQIGNDAGTNKVIIADAPLTNVVLRGGNTRLTPTGATGPLAMEGLLGRAVTPRYFGAVGDGATDDGVALQRWLTYGCTNGAVLELEALTYRFTTTLSVPANTARLMIRGAGRNSSVLASAVNGASALNIGDSQWVYGQDFTLTGTTNSGHGIRAVDPGYESGAYLPQQLHLDRVVVTGFGGSDTDHLGAAMPACGVFAVNGLEMHFNACYIGGGKIGAYFFKTYTARVFQTVFYNSSVADLIEQQNEAFSVGNCDFVSGPGTSNTVTLVVASLVDGSVSIPGGHVVSVDSLNTVISGSKLKNGWAQIVTKNPHEPVLEKNEIVVDVQYGVLNYGPVKARENFFYPFFVGGASTRDYMRFYLPAGRMARFGTIDGNTFDMGGGGVFDAFIRIDAPDASYPGSGSISKNYFGNADNRANATTFGSGVVLTGYPDSIELANNTVHVPGNATITNLWDLPTVAYGSGPQVLRNYAQSVGGTIVNTLVPPGAGYPYRFEDNGLVNESGFVVGYASSASGTNAHFLWNTNFTSVGPAGWQRQGTTWVPVGVKNTITNGIVVGFGGGLSQSTNLVWDGNFLTAHNTALVLDNNKFVTGAATNGLPANMVGMTPTNTLLVGNPSIPIVLVENVTSAAGKGITTATVTLPGGDVQTQLDGKQATDSDLTAVAGLSGTGVMVRTGTGTATTRTVTGTASQVTVTNGDGVSGNPVLSLPSPVVLPGALTTGGRVLIPYATLGSTTIDCSAGDVFIKSVGTGETYTFSNTPSSGKMQWVTVRLFNSSGGTITPAFTGATFTASLNTIAASKYGEYTFAVYGDGVIHGVEQRSF